jgi:hypothetical protein
MLTVAPGEGLLPETVLKYACVFPNRRPWFAGDRMKRFVEGADRGQSSLFSECLDDGIDENNPVRVIDGSPIRSIWLNSGSKGSRRRRLGGPLIIPRLC